MAVSIFHRLPEFSTTYDIVVSCPFCDLHLAGYGDRGVDDTKKQTGRHLAQRHPKEMAFILGWLQGERIKKLKQEQFEDCYD
jgi:hypothetical protein